MIFSRHHLHSPRRRPFAGAFSKLEQNRKCASKSCNLIGAFSVSENLLSSDWMIHWISASDMFGNRHRPADEVTKTPSSLRNILQFVASIRKSKSAPSIVQKHPQAKIDQIRSRGTTHELIVGMVELQREIRVRNSVDASFVICVALSKTRNPELLLSTQEYMYQCKLER